MIGKSANKGFLLAVFLLLIFLPSYANAASCLPTGTTTNPASCLQKDAKGNYTNIMAGTSCLVQAIITESMFEVYCSIVAAWVPVLKAAVTLYIIFYFIAVLFGINNKKLSGGTIIDLIKLMVIYSLAANPAFFYQYMYSFFISGMNGFTEIILGAGGGFVQPGGLFANLDLFFGQIINKDSLVGWFGLALAFFFITSGYGIFVNFLLFIGIGAMIMAMLRVITTYITATMSVTFVMMFAPIFLTSLLFSKTKKLFDGWLSVIISYTIQAVIVIAFMFVALEVYKISNIAEFFKGTTIEESATVHRVQLDKIPGPDKPIIDMNGKYEIPIIVTTIDVYAPKIEGDDDLAMIGRILWTVTALLITLIVLMAMTSSFISMVPDIARQLGSWNGARAPVIGGASSSFENVSGYKGGGPIGRGGKGTSGFYTAGGLLSDLGTMARGGVVKGLSGLSDAANLAEKVSKRNSESGIETLEKEIKLKERLIDTIKTRPMDDSAKESIARINSEIKELNKKIEDIKSPGNAAKLAGLIKSGEEFVAKKLTIDGWGESGGLLGNAKNKSKKNSEKANQDRQQKVTRRMDEIESEAASKREEKKWRLKQKQNPDDPDDWELIEDDD